MKKITLALLLFISLTINITAAGTIFYHYWRGKKCQTISDYPKKPFRRFLKDHLNLPENEASHLQSIFFQDKKDLLNLKKEIHQQREVLIDLLSEKEIDESKINQQIQKMSTLQTQIEQIVIKRFISIKSRLPEEKQEELLKLILQKAYSRSFRGPFGGFGLGKKRRWW